MYGCIIFLSFAHTIIRQSILSNSYLLMYLFLDDILLCNRFDLAARRLVSRFTCCPSPIMLCDVIFLATQSFMFRYHGVYELRPLLWWHLHIIYFDTNYSACLSDLSSFYFFFSSLFIALQVPFLEGNINRTSTSLSTKRKWEKHSFCFIFNKFFTDSSHKVESLSDNE